MSVKIQTLWLCLQISCPYYLQRHHGPWRGQKKAHWWKNSRVFLLIEIFIINKQNIPLHHFLVVNANIPAPHFCPLLWCVTERGTKNRPYSLLSHSHHTPCLPLPPPPQKKKSCISIVSNFSWDLQSSQEHLCKILGGKQCHLWLMWK